VLFEYNAAMHVLYRAMSSVHPNLGHGATPGTKLLHSVTLWQTNRHIVTLTVDLQRKRKTYGVGSGRSGTSLCACS
jgi:hypothetical protein